ncbi:MAG: alpha/beta fold hydrolase [Bdellovibrionia bacterium]
MAYLDNFFYQLTGPESGRKWVFVHGLMGYGGNWRRIISALEGSERCLSYDQRGHGRSFKPVSGFAPEDYSEDLKLILKELGWEKIILVGHSMGGRNVLNFAHRYPEMVEKLVIEDIGPEAKPGAHEYYEYLLNLVPTPFATRAEAKKFLMEDFVQIAKTREPASVLAQYFYANMAETNEGTVDWRFSRQGVIDSVRQGREDDRWHEVRGLKMPTLLIRGERSQDLSQEVYEKMLESNNLMRGVVVSNSGHWVHADQPQEFIQHLKSFVGVL